MGSNSLQQLMHISNQMRYRYRSVDGIYMYDLKQKGSGKSDGDPLYLRTDQTVHDGPEIDALFLWFYDPKGLRVARIWHASPGFQPLLSVTIFGPWCTV